MTTSIYFYPGVYIFKVLYVLLGTFILHMVRLSLKIIMNIAFNCGLFSLHHIISIIIAGASSISLMLEEEDAL